VRSFPQLKLVEIWNEWPYRPGAGPDQLARLVKAVSQRLKAIRPDLTIVGPNLETNQPDEKLRLVLEEGIIDSVDGISWHPYRPNPDTLAFRCERMQAMLREFNDGKDKPLYLTEHGVSTAKTPGGFTEHQQAVYAAKSLLWARTVPYVKGLWLYNFVDCTVKEPGVWHPEYGEDNFGFLKHDLTPKPVYWVIRDIAKLIRQGHFLRLVKVPPDWKDTHYLYIQEYWNPTENNRVYPIWHTRKGWGCWLTFKVLTPHEQVVQLLKLGTGIPVEKKLTEEGLFNLYVEGDDIPWLVSARCESLQVAGVKWVSLGESSPAGGPYVEAKQFTEKPQVDGDLSEWSNFTFTEIKPRGWWYAGPGPAADLPAEDLSARFAVGWDPKTLYVAVEVVDDTHTQPHLDVDTRWADTVQLAWWCEGDPANGFFELGFAKTSAGDKTVPYNLPRRMWPNFRQTLESVRKSIRREAATTIYEIAIPVSPGFLPALTASEQLRFSLLVTDSDEGDGSPPLSAYWGNNIAWWIKDRNLDPEQYGIVTFVAQEG